MNYKKHYDNLIKTRLLLKEKRIHEKRNKINYYEGHHIIPKSQGGQGQSYNFNHPNIVLLTAREHFIAHWLLVKFDPIKSNINAFWRMCIGKNTPKKYYSSRAYEEARILHSNSMIGNKNALGNNTPKSNTKNMRWSKEKRKKILEKVIGQKRNSKNMKGNKYFLGKKRNNIKELRQKQVTDGNQIFISKEDCMNKLEIKNNYQFYKKIKDKTLQYV